MKFFLLLFVFEFWDVNSYDRNTLTVTLSEDAIVGVPLVNLEDDMKNLHNKLNTKLLLGLSQNNYFFLNKTWNLYTIRSLDRDKNSDLCKERTELETCIWSGIIMFENPSDIISLRIEIKDVNDNKPTWSKPIMLEVLENNAEGKTFELPQAQDDDSAPYDVQRYDLLDNSYHDLFQLIVEQSQTGLIPKLIIRGTLDFERQKSYHLEMCAVDGANPFHKGFVKIIIKILDQNDNTPIFDKNLITISIPENYPISKPLPQKVTATDSDSGLFGTIFYDISSSSSSDILKTFRINKTTGDIFLLTELDYDIGTKYYKFYVIAKDKGVPSLSASATIELNIQDINDQPPQILVNSYSQSTSNKNPASLFITENNQIGQTLARITATDKDNINNDYCNCTLERYNDFMLKFERYILKMTIYKLITNKIFDREAQGHSVVVVVCSDMGSPPITSKETLTIFIEDVNDNQPQFEKAFYSFMVYEGNAPNTIIARVNATDDDLDLNGKVSYYMESLADSKNITDLIRVNIKGEIIALQELDRESNLQGYKFKILAVDLGTIPLTGTTIIEINFLDVNDCFPQFTKDVHELSVEEDYSLGTLFRPRSIGSVKAFDADIFPNGISYYEIVSNDVPFEVTSAGNIRTKSIIDREIRDEYNLTIIAVDGAHDSNVRHTVSTWVIIVVKDINDNPPQFYFPKNSTIQLNVSFHEEPGYVITKVQATDMDEGDNGKISYQIILGNIYGIFDIDSTSGRLSIHQNMHSPLKALITLTVIAKDHGNPSLSSTATIQLMMTDSPPTGGDKSQLSNQFTNGTQTNQILIFIIVSITCVICIGLITIICLMARGIVFRQRYCKALADKQIIEDRNSTISRRGYCPAMMPMIETDLDTLSHYRNSLIDNPYCSLQIPVFNPNYNHNPHPCSELFPKDQRHLTFPKIVMEQQNNSDSDSGHGNSMNNHIQGDSKENLVLTSFGTFSPQPMYSSLAAFTKFNTSDRSDSPRTMDSLQTTYIKYST